LPNNFLNDQQSLFAGKGVVNYAFPVLLKRAAVESVIGMVNLRKQQAAYSPGMERTTNPRTG